jgi:hypothetical protein
LKIGKIFIKFKSFIFLKNNEKALIGKEFPERKNLWKIDTEKIK